jgi:hypothetical protein
MEYAVCQKKILFWDHELFFGKKLSKVIFLSMSLVTTHGQYNSVLIMNIVLLEEVSRDGGNK